MKNKIFTSDEQDAIEQVIQLRRDVRGNHFIDKPIADETIQRILSAAVCAPSVGFSQPWEFVIIRDKNVKSKVADIFSIENEKAKAIFENSKPEYSQLKLEGIYEAPVNVAVFYKPSKDAVLGQTSMQNMEEYSVVCAIQNMWLMSRALNVGLGWVSILDQEKVKHALSAPLEAKLIAYLCIGYVDTFLDKPELETLRWSERRSEDDFIHHDNWRHI